jgi:hypothetical protein
VSARALIPAAFAAAATVTNLGTAGLAWVGPMLVVAAVVLVVRALRRRSHRELRSLAIFTGIALVVALPVIVSSAKFFKNAQQSIADPHAVGNLLAPVSVFQSLNFWLAEDYRFPNPDATTVSYIGMVLAGLLALIGLFFVLYRWNFGIVLATVAGVSGVAFITPRTSIYYDAKTYAALAPALGLLSAAGVFTLIRLPRFTALGAVAGILLAAGVVASDLYTHWGVWVTPKQRFEEMASIADRLAGKGSILINEREAYSAYFFRRTHPWNDHGYPGQVDYPHVRFKDSVAPPPPRGPDFDDYPIRHVEVFDWLLDRSAPGASRPPSNYAVAEETRFYRLWRRIGPAPRDHLAFGSDGMQGAAPVKCSNGRPRRAALRGIAAEAIRDRAQLAVALPGLPPRRILKASDWILLTPGKVIPPPGMVTGRGGTASGTKPVPPGLYTAWLQGSFGPGARLYARSGLSSGAVGEAHGDLGSPDGWFRLGTFRAVAPRTTFTLIGLGPPWWHAGSHHANIIGDLRIEPAGTAPRIVNVDPRRIDRLCGQRVDWVEVPPIS